MTSHKTSRVDWGHREARLFTQARWGQTVKPPIRLFTEAAKHTSLG
jgi:hypothetical protein